MFKNSNFIEHSIVSVLFFLRELLWSESYALQKGFLQSKNARLKIPVFLFFIITIVLLKNIFWVIVMYFFCLLLAYFSKIDLLFFLKRTLVFIPISSVFAIFPALFSIFSPGPVLFALNILGRELIVTQTGCYSVLLLVFRILSAVSFVVLLNLVTRRCELLKTLRIFNIPQVFVLTLNMAHRYIHLFIGIVLNTYLAIKSRVGRPFNCKKGQELVIWNMAVLWQRSYKLNHDVYQAMLSRGYSGEYRVLEEPRIHISDWCWFIIALAISFSVLYRGI